MGEQGLAPRPQAAAKSAPGVSIHGVQSKPRAGLLQIWDVPHSDTPAEGPSTPLASPGRSRPGPPPTLSKYLPNEANLYGLKWNLFTINGCVKNKVKGQQQTEWASIWAFFFFFFLTRGITDGKPSFQAEGMGGFSTQTFVARTFFTM